MSKETLEVSDLGVLMSPLSLTLLTLPGALRDRLRFFTTLAFFVFTLARGFLLVGVSERICFSRAASSAPLDTDERLDGGR